MAVEERCGRDFRAPEVFGDGFEGEGFGCFGREEEGGGLGEVRVLGGLVFTLLEG